jgi:hypothetical protein
MSIDSVPCGDCGRTGPSSKRISPHMGTCGTCGRDPKVESSYVLLSVKVSGTPTQALNSAIDIVDLLSTSGFEVTVLNTIKAPE